MTEDDETCQWTQTMSRAQVERMRELCPEGLSDQERVRLLVEEALQAREKTVTPDSIQAAIEAALGRAVHVDEEGRLCVVDDGDS